MARGAHPAHEHPPRPEAFYPARGGLNVPGMLSGSLLHHWLVTGLSAVTFILALKMLGPHLPEGLQKLVGSI